MMGRKIVYVCSPFRGDKARNKEYARELTLNAIRLNLTPITPHLYITECLSDSIEEERILGLNVAMDLLIHSDAILLGNKYGISDGMQAELNTAKEYGIPILEKGLTI